MMAVDVLSPIKAVKRVYHSVCWFFFQVNIHLGICIMEPWEKFVFYMTVFTIIMTAMYTTFLFMPGHIKTWRYLVMYLSKITMNSTITLTGGEETMYSSP